MPPEPTEHPAYPSEVDPETGERVPTRSPEDLQTEQHETASSVAWTGAKLVRLAYRRRHLEQNPSDLDPYERDQLNMEALDLRDDLAIRGLDSDPRVKAIFRLPGFDETLEVTPEDALAYAEELALSRWAQAWARTAA